MTFRESCEEHEMNAGVRSVVEHQFPYAGPSDWTAGQYLKMVDIIFWTSGQLLL